MIGVKLVTGGSISDSFLVDGVAFAQTFTYAGANQQPKKFVNPKILILNVELEKKAERENAEVRIDKPQVIHFFSRFPLTKSSSFVSIGLPIDRRC